MPFRLIWIAVGLSIAAVLGWQAMQAPRLPEPPCLNSMAAVKAALRQPNPALAELDDTIERLEQGLAQQPGAQLLVDQLIAKRSVRFRTAGDIADWQRAHTLSQQALQARPQSALVQARHANLLNSVHRFEEALPLARTAASAGGDDQTRGTLFDSLLELGRQAEADTVLQAIGDDTVAGALRHARWADLRGDSARTIALTRHALEQARKQSMHPLAQAGLQANLGVFLLYDSDDANVGLAALCEAVALHPTQAAAWEALAKVAWHRGELDLAYALAAGVAARSPVHAGLQLLAAELALARDDTAGAARHHAAFESVATSDGPLYELPLAEYLVAHPPTQDQAVHLARMAFAHRPSREVADTLAWVLTHAGQAADALPVSDQVAASGAMHAPLAYRRGVVLAANDNGPAAAESLRGALDGWVELSPPEVADARRLLERLE